MKTPEIHLQQQRQLLLPAAALLLLPLVDHIPITRVAQRVGTGRPVLGWSY